MRKPRLRPTGYKKDGRIDLRFLPEIVRRPLGREQADGQATQRLHEDVGGDKKPTGRPRIEIDSRLFGRARMEAEVHEGIHLACPFLFEIVVGPVARYLTMLLWHIGYRLNHEDD